MSYGTGVRIVGLKAKSGDLRGIRRPDWDLKGLLISCAYSGKLWLHVPTLTVSTN